MRWFWIDRFLEFESGCRAKAIKCVSLAEDYLHDHFPEYPLFPNSLVIEGMAQTGGLLVCEHSQFTEKVILVKINRAQFHCHARPGDTLTYAAMIERKSAEGARSAQPATLASDCKRRRKSSLLTLTPLGWERFFRPKCSFP